jgi:single-strand DNA-binding protein
MRDTNIFIMSGRLTRDPEMRHTKESKAVCNFSLACNDSKEKVNFFDCQAWEKTAEIITEHCKKGQKILITGRLNQQRWDDENGKPRSKNVVNVQNFEFMGSKNSETSGADAVRDSFNGEDIPEF